MLVELSKVEQRYDAVLAVIRDGLTVSEAAIAYGVSRQTIYRWMQRYEQGGLAALAERSHRPQSCPHQMDAKIEDRIITLRRVNPLGARSVPSTTSSERVLRRSPRTWPSIGPWCATT